MSYHVYVQHFLNSNYDDDIGESCSREKCKSNNKHPFLTFTKVIVIFVIWTTKEWQIKILPPVAKDAANSVFSPICPAVRRGVYTHKLINIQSILFRSDLDVIPMLAEEITFSYVWGTRMGRAHLLWMIQVELFTHRLHFPQPVTLWSTFDNNKLVCFIILKSR